MCNSPRGFVVARLFKVLLLSLTKKGVVLLGRRHRPLGVGGARSCSGSERTVALPRNVGDRPFLVVVVCVLRELFSFGCFLLADSEWPFVHRFRCFPSSSCCRFLSITALVTCSGSNRGWSDSSPSDGLFSLLLVFLPAFLSVRSFCNIVHPLSGSNGG